VAFTVIVLVLSTAQSKPIKPFGFRKAENKFDSYKVMAALK